MTMVFNRFRGIIPVAIAMAVLGLPGCESTGSRVNDKEDAGSDTDTDSDSDSDTDSDTDSDSDSDGDDILSFIWIANSMDDTLSKVDTQTAVEVARYRTCPSDCNPSRTSVNLHGDAVVTNRTPFLLSVTKFAAAIDDCVDGNDNGTIETSTGSTDVLNWGEDECMLWHTEHSTGGSINELGARATAWDGKEDSDTGTGGNVWVGTCGDFSVFAPQMVYKLDGDSGAIVDQTSVDNVRCCYGGAVDGNDGFWVHDHTAFAADDKIVRVDMNTLPISEPIALQEGYGITADSQGRVWIGGGCSVSRHDPADGSLEVLLVADAYYLRGIAVGVEKSAGYVWSADTDGTLYKIDQENMIVADTYEIGLQLVGVAADFEGYVWAVDKDANAAYKFDPDTETYVTVPIGQGPYTYSDMTGVQLKSVIIIE